MCIVEEEVYPRESIIKEYNSSCETNKDEHEMCKWGSHKSMINRIKAVERIIDFSVIQNWLDIGCGPGTAQKYYATKFISLHAYGLDISPKMIDYAMKQNISSNTYFETNDFMQYNPNKYFDCITSLGVLQKTNIPPTTFFEKAYQLLNKHGILLINTKNKCWHELESGRYIPQVKHSWFAPNELKHHLEQIGFKHCKLIGFLPYENIFTKTINESHDFFIKAIK